MSMLFGPTSSDPSVSGLPRGEVLGSFPTYLEARKIVDELAGQEFDVRTVSIVGTDLRTVERIRNRLTYPSVALRSAVQGAFFGMMLGILMTLIDPAGSGIQILYTVGLGVAVWVIFGVIGHALRKGRGVNSVQQLVPSNFDVVCEFETAAQAKQLLGRPGAVPAPQRPASPENRQGPTSAPRPATGAPAAPAPAPSPAQSPVQSSEPSPTASPASPERETDSPVPPRTGVFPDLPDGRPQFGVRLPEDEALEVQERILRENAAKNAPAGAGASGAASFEAPSYGKGGSGFGKGGSGGSGGSAGSTADSGGTPTASGRRADRSRPVDGGAASDADSGAAPDAAGERPASGTKDPADPAPPAPRDASGEPGDRD